MEPEEEETLPMQPFWLQNADHLHGRRLRRSYSLLLTSTSFLVLLLVTAITLAFIVVPTLHSFASHIFKPHTIKNSWDSLNLILVIFAIACAFLTKNTTTTTITTEPETPLQRSFSNLRQQDYYVKQNSIPSRTWCEYEYTQRTDYNKSFSRLRSFNSYPDLRQESSWITTEERWRFYDDTHLDSRRQPRREEEEAKEETVIETVATATSKDVASPPPQPPPSSPPRRSKAVRRNAKRTQQAEVVEKPSTLPPPPPPPPPQPVTAEMKTMQGKKRRKSATKEFLTSLTGKKKKKQRHPSVENFETILILNSEPFPIASQPLPELHSGFQNLFSSKKSQHKTKRNDPVAIHKPSSSNKRERCYSLEEKNDVVITGKESPLIPIPPPPPPFRLPAWKFRVQGDFVRVDSIGSSGSSAVEEVAESPVGQEGSQCNSPCDPHGGGKSVGSLFCPSPDVDTKAHSFIERFRAGLRMEKMNSMKEKQGIGRSSLGSSPSPITKQETTPS